MTDTEIQELYDKLVASTFQATILLAIVGAKSNHAFVGIGHSQGFEDCPHRDCILARGYELVTMRAEQS